MPAVEPDWSAIVTALLRQEFPLLPSELPAEVASLVPVWAERMASQDPTVRQEQLGAFSASYSEGGIFTAAEERLLRPYRHARHGSPTIGGPSSERAAERGDWWL